MVTSAEVLHGTLAAMPTASSAHVSSPEDWVEAHGNHLLRYAHSRVRNSHVAEELVQETFIAALKARRRFSGQSSERTWFIGILRHKIIDYFRKSSRERATAGIEDHVEKAQSAFDGGGAWAMAPASWGSEPERAVEQSDFWGVLKKCLDTLPENLSRVFIMREIEDMDSEEICRELGITPNNLWVRLHRARAQLRRGLEERWFLKGQEA